MLKPAVRSPSLAAAPCGCHRCTCAAAPACRCHVLNALVALALWDVRRVLRARAS